MIAFVPSMTAYVVYIAEIRSFILQELKPEMEKQTSVRAMLV